MVLFIFSSMTGGLSLLWMLGLEAMIFSLFLYSSLAAAYLISMPGIESESPSSMIVTFIDSKTSDGASYEDLRNLITDELFILDRVTGLHVEGLIEEKNSKIAITKSGSSFMKLFLFYHYLTGRIPRGG